MFRQEGHRDLALTAADRLAGLRGPWPRPRVQIDMRDGRASLWLALTGALGLALCAVQATAVRAQDWSGSTEGSTTSGPTVEDYLKEAGPDAKLVNQGALKIDGRPVNCGKRPTV